MIISLSYPLQLQPDLMLSTTALRFKVFFVFGKDIVWKKADDSHC